MIHQSYGKITAIVMNVFEAIYHFHVIDRCSMFVGNELAKTSSIIQGMVFVVKKSCKCNIPQIFYNV